TAWTAISTSNAPSARGGHAMAFDSSTNNKVILFGGNDGSMRNDTWLYDGTTWTNLAPATSPSARSGHAMSSNTTAHTVMLFGGFDGSFNSSQNWEWNGTTWASKATGPTSRNNPAIAFDAA